ncbi:MAG: hypothetical protein NW208_06395 [Bryobacter sp.]|nr:hypothetical protein [Bryobacter sp.]
MKLGVIHASRAAVDVVAEYYARAEPGWEITHLLDDGVMRMLRARDWAAAQARLEQHRDDLRRTYGVEQVMVTCSALPLAVVEAMGVHKIDVAMARRAGEVGRRIGVLATFASTQETTREMILAFHPDAEIVEVLEEAALVSLLAGDVAAHDARFFAAVEQFRGRVDVLVLAQVSMARLREEAERRLGVPVLESLSTSLEGLQLRLSM